MFLQKAQQKYNVYGDAEILIFLLQTEPQVVPRGCQSSHCQESFCMFHIRKKKCDILFWRQRFHWHLTDFLGKHAVIVLTPAKTFKVRREGSALICAVTITCSPLKWLCPHLKLDTCRLIFSDKATTGAWFYWCWQVSFCLCLSVCVFPTSAHPGQLLPFSQVRTLEWTPPPHSVLHLVQEPHGDQKIGWGQGTPSLQNLWQWWQLQRGGEGF